MITFLPHNRRSGYRAEYRNSWKDVRDFTTEQLRRELTRPTAVSEWLASDHVTAWCEERRREREEGEQA